MSKKIPVFVDIYLNRFLEDSNYCYGNIRAADDRDEEIVRQCVQRMKEGDSDLLRENQPIRPIPNGSRDAGEGIGFFPDEPPVETDRKCVLDTEKMSFEFGGCDE